MPLVQVPKNIQPRQIEFGDDVERSKPGALYFVPGTVKRITKDELKWIQKNHKRFSRFLVIVQMDDKQSRLAIERAAKVKKTPAKKRPKDQLSKAKQRAEAALKRKGKPVPAPASPPGPPPSSPVFIPPPADDDGGGSSKKKKK